MKLGGFLRSRRELLSDWVTDFRASQPVLHLLPFDCEPTPKLSPTSRTSQGEQDPELSPGMRKGEMCLFPG